MSTEDLTPLQADIKEMINAYPNLDDKEIARKVWEKSNPSEPYEGSSPTHQYVSKMRKRFDIEAQPPTFTVEQPEIDFEEDEEYEEYEEDEEELEPDFESYFEPPEEVEIPEPEEPRSQIEGLTYGDTEFLLVFTFGKFADWSGWEGWRFETDNKGRLVKPDEQRFAKLTNRMAEKYLPEIFELYFLEVMFCWTAIMIVGGKAKGYSDWRKKKRLLPPPDSTIVEEKPVKPEELHEISDIEAQPESTGDEPEREAPILPAGAKAQGEGTLLKRLRRQPT